MSKKRIENWGIIVVKLSLAGLAHIGSIYKDIKEAISTDGGGTIQFRFLSDGRTYVRTDVH